MEVKLDKRYPLDVDAARAWAVLRDVPATAGCMPGAAITEQVDETHYKGNVKVKIGPANAAINGTIEVLALDEEARRVELLGKGADRTGSQASMKLIATVEPGEAPGSSVLVGNAEVNVTGKLAQFGGRMMVQVADLLLAQFADNFRAAAAAAVPVDEVRSPTDVAGEPPAGDGTQVATAVAAGADTGAAIGAGQAAQPGSSAEAAWAGASAGAAPAARVPAQEPEPTSAVAPDPHIARASPATAAAAHAAAPSAAAPAATPLSPMSSAAGGGRPQPARQTEINGLALVWALVKGWFGRLFGRG